MHCKILFLLLIFSPALSQKQTKFRKIVEERKFEGTIEKYKVIFGIAYNSVAIRMDEKLILVKFDRSQGKELVENFPVGTRVTGVSRGSKLDFKPYNEKASKGFKELFSYFTADSLVSIKSSTQETVANWQKRKKLDGLFINKKTEKREVFFDQKIEKIVEIDNGKKALLLKKKNLLVESPFFDFPKRGWNSGVEVSFVGYEIDLRPGEAYPIEGFTTAMNVNRLTKESAAIESFYYKQNGVCIGLKANTSMGSIKLNFPSIYAKKIMELEKRKEPITIYFDRFKGDPKSFLFPTIHGLICGRDTLRMEDNYYGDPDGDHDYSSISSKGVITKLNFSAKQKIVSLVVDEHYLLEIDTKTESQLKAYLKKGKSIGFEGDQHIKKEGEVYQFDYQIVSPKKLTLEGREFLLYNR
jgi:hypothetical protein